MSYSLARSLAIALLFSVLLPTSAWAKKASIKVAPVKTEKEFALLGEIPFSHPSKPRKSGTDAAASTGRQALKALKIAESSKQWDVCLKLAPKNFQEQKLIRDWILNTWIHCAVKSFEEKHNINESAPALLAVEKNRDLLVSGPARNTVLQNMFKLRTDYAEYLEKQDFKKNLKAAKENLEVLLTYGDRLDKESWAKVLYYYAELAQNNHQLMAAKQLLEQSLGEKDSHIAREKLNSIQLALGTRDSFSPHETEAPVIALLPDAELKSEDRLDQSLASNDLIAYMEDGISYLKKYPNGRRAKGVHEKILEIYIQIYEHSISTTETDVQKYVELKERALLFMEKAEPQRLLDWAKSLHRRSDFNGAIRLAEKSAPQFMATSQSSSLLWLLGRSAQFLGQYSRAQKYFEQYLELSSGGEEYTEVQMRLALVYLRQHQYSSAVATLEKLLLTKNLDRYELISRYWLIRSLQAEKNPRAASEVASFIERFPFSYYGVRLRAESNQGSLDWPSSLQQGPQFDVSLYLTDYQKKIMDRINLLADNTWYFEAQKEVQELPPVKDPMQKVLLSQRWASVKAFPVIIKLTNEAGDSDPRLRALDLIAVSFPQEYAQQIQKEADRNHLNPFLVKSLIRQESAFGPQATSSSNALGLMQLIPPTANEVAQDLRLGKLNVPEDVFDPDVNIQMGTFYLAKMIKKFGGSVPLGLAAYNAGPQKMQRFVAGRLEVAAQMSSPSSDPFEEIWIDELPWYETSFYVKAILRNVLIYKTLEQGKFALAPLIWGDLVQSRAETTTH